MPFRHQEPSRAERVRCAVQGRTADAATTLSGAATTAAASARGAALTAAGATQDAAHVVADRAALAAHEAADRASAAASTVADRARPFAAEAAQRTAAAWQILRHGVPRRGPMARVASVVPMATVTTAARRGRAPMGLMVLGAAGAVGVLLWRRARMDRDTVWILDDDSDNEPVGRWHEGDSRAGAHDDLDSRAHRARDGRDLDSPSHRRDSPANRWP
ncbi:hypothetical protein GCM10009838_14510 [Catenulispora subtropica]|uniref:Uncharacterized protein n=2 Tax=Catenulispora subtropica TaxID=450798 RepID=A0ABP5C7Y0_9ACTN